MALRETLEALLNSAARWMCFLSIIRRNTKCVNHPWGFKPKEHRSASETVELQDDWKERSHYPSCCATAREICEHIYNVLCIYTYTLGFRQIKMSLYRC